MNKKKGFTLVEVLISFFLIVVVMIYLLRTIIAIGNKNSELITYQEFSVYENNLLDTIYKDIDPVFDTEEFLGLEKCTAPSCVNTMGANDVDLISTISFNDVDKKMVLDREKRTITYGDVIYQLPDGVKFREGTSMYNIAGNFTLHDYFVLTIKLTVGDKDEDIKLVYQNKYSDNVMITYDANGGTPEIISVHRKSGEKLGLLPTVTYTNHDFAGWYTRRSGGIKVNENTIPTNNQTTYYAQWIAQTYTINYYDGDTKLGTSNHEKDIPQNLKDITELGGGRDGWTFYGWTPDTDNTERSYENGQSVVNLPSNEGVINLYAIWSRDANFYSGINKEKVVQREQHYNPTSDKYIVRPPADLADTIELDTFSRNGWRIDGLSSKSEYPLRGSDITSSSKNYYLVYYRTLILNYNGNGETSGSVERQTEGQYYNSKNAKDNISSVQFTLRTNKFKKTGSTFVSWDVGEPGTKYTFKPAADQGRNGYANAQWSATEYTVTYKGNGGSNNGYSTWIDPTKATYNNNYLIHGNMFTRKGYTFTGWNTKADGSGTQMTLYIDKQWKYSWTSDLTLYAQWEANEYTIAYHGNGGTWSGSTNWVDTIRGPAIYGRPYKTYANFFRRPGYTFAGWNEKADGTGVDWTPWIERDWTWTYTKNVSLYAQWIPNSMTIRYYNGSDNNSLLTTQTVYYDGTDFSTYGLPNYDGGTWNLTRSGYNPSKYWDVEGPGSPIKINEDTVFAKNQNLAEAMGVLNHFNVNNITVDVYAGWTPKTLLVTFKSNGATSGEDNQTQTFTYGVPEQSFTDKGLSRTGYTLIGWNTNPNATEGLYGGCIQCQVDDGWINANSPSITLYAVWTQNPTIRTVFHYNNGENGVVDQTFTKGVPNQKFGYRPDGTSIWGTTGQFGAWDRKGFKLLGWSINQNDTQAQYGIYSPVGDPWIDGVYNNTSGNTPNRTIHLYAIWQRKKITVDLSQYGTTTGSNPVTIYFYYGINKVYKDAACTQQIDKIVTPTKQDYTFDQYWGDGSSGGGYKERYIYYDGTFADDMVTDIYKDATFQPEWILNESSGGGGGGSGGGGNVAPGCAIYDYTIYSPQECGMNGWTCTAVQPGYRSIDFGCASASYDGYITTSSSVPQGYWVARDCTNYGCSGSSKYYWYNYISTNKYSGKSRYSKKYCTQFNSFAGWNSNYSTGFMLRCN